MRTSSPQAAFTLVELSIVLVIIGLLVGGIFTGQALIRSSELRSVAEEYTRFQTAVTTFKDKYGAYPGDLRDATAYWGEHTAACAGGATVPHTSIATCNGNGNGVLELHGAPNNTNETFTFWHHLQNAGLVQGPVYSGGSANGTNFDAGAAQVGVNIPASKFPFGGWNANYQGEVPISSTVLIEGNYGHAFLFGGNDPLLAGANITPALMPEDAFSLDTKLDDGRAGTGTIVSMEQLSACHTTPAGAAAPASNSTPRADSVYALGNAARSCTLLFRQVF